MRHPAWATGVLMKYFTSQGFPRHENYPEEYQGSILSGVGSRDAMRADSLDWDDIAKFRDIWPGILMLKGVNRPDDAMKALGYGIDGIVVSNHGGRNMDSAAATLDVLPEIAEAVGDRCTLILDSGVRRGSDIVKALALGAKAVLTGRATLYGTAVGGEAGALKAINILKNEADKTMAYTGCRTVDEVTTDIFLARATATGWATGSPHNRRNSQGGKAQRIPPIGGVRCAVPPYLRTGRLADRQAGAEHNRAGCQRRDAQPDHRPCQPWRLRPAQQVAGFLASVHHRQSTPMPIKMHGDPTGSRVHERPVTQRRVEWRACRISRLSDLSAENQDLLKRRISLFQALVNSPERGARVRRPGQFIRFGSKLDPRLRELAILQVGWLARSPYEWSHHVKLGHDFGVTRRRHPALIDDTAGKPTQLDDMAKTVLRAAREMTQDGAMSDATFATLQTALGNEQVVDLTITIAFYNAVVRVLATLQIDVEDDYMPYLRQFPLPA